MKRFFAALLVCLAYALPSHAVLKESDLPKSLSVLREELKRDCSEQRRLIAMFDTVIKSQHQDIIDVMQRSKQVGLMLYSQHEDYTFDLTYSCHEATMLYYNFSNGRKPYNSIVNTFETNIDRYTRLIASLEKLPPVPESVRKAMWVGLSSDSIAKMKAAFAEMQKDTAQMRKLKEFQLDAKGCADRDSCLAFAKTLLEQNKMMLEKVKADNEHYEFVQNHLKEANDYAAGCYEKLQHEIFVDGGPSYLTMLKQFPRYWNKVKNEIDTKYIAPSSNDVPSDWSGKIVFGLLIFVLFYMLVAGVLASLIIKGITVYSVRHKDTLKSPFLKAFASASKDKRVCTALTLAVILFAIALMFAISFMNHNFLVMACKLLIEYAWLLGVTLLSLLVRLPGNYIKGGISLYAPMLLMGFLIIGLRIIFVPNDVLNLFFPIVLVLFLVFQWYANRRFKAGLTSKLGTIAKEKASQLMVRENEEAKASFEQKREKRLAKAKREQATEEELDAIRNEVFVPLYYLDPEDPAYRSYTSDEIEEKKQAYAEEFAKKEGQCRHAEESFTHSDRMYALISLCVMAVATFAAFRGFTFFSLQIFIWWLFQLTCIHTITSLFDLLKKGEQRFLKDKLFEAACDLERRKQGRMDIDVSKVKVDYTNLKDRNKFISQTWFFDLCRICVVPVMGAFSVFFSILWAADVFNLTEFCKDIFFTNFIDVEGVIQLSIFKITLAIALFFVFSFLSYLVKAIYRSVSQQKNLVDNHASTSLFNNLSGLVVWCVYFIILLSLLQVPKSGISLVTAGLATGVGFAMKDLLENFFYGVSLMTGRVRVGEWIECDGVRGKVEKISYQSTSISTLDGYIISFLNASLFTKNFKNLTRSHEYEFLPLNIGIAYGSDIEKARNVIVEAVKGCNEKLEGNRDSINLGLGVKVIVSSLSDSSVDLYVSLWTDVAKKYWVKGRCLEAIYNSLNKNGISIPFPQRDVHIIHDNA